MKNLIKILSLQLIMSAVTFIACNKQELVNNSNETDPYFVDYIVDGISRYLKETNDADCQ